MINFGSFAKACHIKSFYSAFLLFLEQQGAHEYYSLTKNQERTTLPSTTSDWQRARVKRKNVCKSKAWRDGANLKAHIESRAFPREIPVRGRFFFERRFQSLSVEGFFWNQRKSISRCPKSPFPSKTQNRQVARNSPSRACQKRRIRSLDDVSTVGAGAERGVNNWQANRSPQRLRSTKICA